MASNPAPGFIKHSGYNIELQPAEPVVIRIGSRIIAQSSAALSLLEGAYSPVLYIPFEDVASDHFSQSETTTYCPFKGTASYWNVFANSEATMDAAWSYEEPFDNMRAIKGHFAFYPEKVDIRQF